MNAEEKDRPGRGEGERKRSLPCVGVPVWVLCAGYRTMAYLDKDGAWRTVADGKVLTGVMGLVEE